MIKLNIPVDGCAKCPYLSKETIDHNYYGETSEVCTCTLFAVPIKNNIPCDKCVIQQEENQKDIVKYANFLVKEIEKMASETRNRTLGELIGKVADVVRYTKDGNSYVDFSKLLDIVNTMREN